MRLRSSPTSFIALSALLTAAVFVAYSAWAGPLDPPAGAVAPTMKTLVEVEPRIAVNATNTPGDASSLFKITQPGSYYLTGNITGVVGKHGIAIVASGVTLDLNGFDVAGVAGSLDGVSVTVNGVRNIAVVNGSVRNWGGDGLDLQPFGVSNCRLSDVLASFNTGNGLFIGVGCTVTNCSAQDNITDGINTAVGCAVSNCTALNNTGNGITLGGSSTLVNCTAFGNLSHGISTNTSSGTGSVIADCAARLNSLDGIRCVAGCVIRGNSCTFNGNSGAGGAGIHATGADNRVEGNDCTTADRGIEIDVAGNIIIRNTCAGNTIDWVIAANNVFGPIIDRRAPASAAVSGFTAASTLGSTDPNANYSY